MKRIRIRIKEDIRIPGTNILLEKGDIVHIKEARAFRGDVPVRIIKDYTRKGGSAQRDYNIKKPYRNAPDEVEEILERYDYYPRTVAGLGTIYRFEGKPRSYYGDALSYPQFVWIEGKTFWVANTSGTGMESRVVELADN